MKLLCEILLTELKMWLYFLLGFRKKYFRQVLTFFIRSVYKMVIESGGDIRREKLIFSSSFFLRILFTFWNRRLYKKVKTLYLFEQNQEECDFFFFFWCEMVLSQIHTLCLSSLSLLPQSFSFLIFCLFQPSFLWANPLSFIITNKWFLETRFASFGLIVLLTI